MDPRSQKLLEDTFALAEENNKILRKMRRSQRISSFLRLFYWILIIGASIGAFYYLQPYVDRAVSTYDSISGTANKLNGGKVNIEDLLKKFAN